MFAHFAYTPLHSAALFGHLPAVQLLVESGFDVRRYTCRARRRRKQSHPDTLFSDPTRLVKRRLTLQIKACTIMWPSI